MFAAAWPDSFGVEESIDGAMLERFGIRSQEEDDEPRFRSARGVLKESHKAMGVRPACAHEAVQGSHKASTDLNIL